MAGVYKGLNIKIGADTTGLSDALNRIDAQARGLTREMRAVDKALKLDPKNTDLARQKMEAYQKEIQSASERLKTLRAAEEQIGKEGMSSDAWNTLQRDIAATEGGINRLTGEYRSFTVEQAAATSGLGKAGTALTELGAKMEPAAQAMEAAGARMSAAITAPAVAAGTASVKIAMDFEASLAKVSTLADESKMSMGEIGDGARELAVTYGTSASEINEALYQAMSASIDTASALGFVDTATRLSKAGFTESATAVDVLTTAINAYGMSADDAAHVSDVLVNTQNLGKTTVNELAQSMGNVIPTAAAYGVNLENLASAYAVMTKQGINTANATTAINGMLTELADNGSDVNAILQEMTGKTFGQIMKDGASLGDVLSMLSSSVDGDSEAFANLWGNVRASKGALAIANAGAAEFNGTLESMANSAGTVDAALEKVGGTTQASLSKAKAAVEDAAISVGQVLLPYVAEAAAAVKGGAEAFNSLSDGEKEAIVKTAALAAGIGPVLLLLSKAMGLVGTLGSGLVGLAKNLAALDLATNGTARGFKAAAKAGEELSGKAMLASTAMGAAKAAAIGLAIAGVMLLVSAIKTYLDQQAQFDKATRGVVDATRGLKSAADVAATGLDRQSESTGAAAAAAGSYYEAALKAAEAGAQLADSISATISAAESDAGTAQAYADAILELAGNCAGSAEKVAELQGNVDAYNELTGSSVAVVDEFSGRINVNTEELKANTAAFKENAYAKAAGEVYQEAVRHEVEISNELRTQKAELEDAAALLEELSRTEVAAAGANGEVIHSKEYEEAAQRVDELANSVSRLEGQQVSAAKASENARTMMGEYATEAKRAEEESKRAALSTEDFRNAFDDLGRSGDAFDEVARSMGTDADALAESLKQAGIGTEELSRIGLENFDRLRAGAQGDFGKVASAIAVIDALGIDPKYVEVDDSGVVTADGHVIDLKNRKIDGKTFEVSDKGTIKETSDKLSGIERIKIGDKTVTVNLDDRATEGINGIANKLTSLVSKTWTVVANAVGSVGHASGGITPEPIRLPAHASGGLTGVLTRATVTSEGVVGEDGNEYVHDFAGGSAIVPIQNTRYVRPLARSIAEELAPLSTPQQAPAGDINVYLNYDAGADAQELFNDFAGIVKRQRAMGVI